MVTLEHNGLVIRSPAVHSEVRLSVSFQRTLRVPDDGRTYPLPAGFGRFPVRHVEDYAQRLPRQIRERGGVLLPMHQAEALWIRFDTDWPMAVQVGTGKVCAITGSGWSDKLRRDPEQNYVITPQQPWLDGYAVRKGTVRQFVAMPLGQGYTVEEQRTGAADWGGIQLRAVPLRREVWERERPRAGLGRGLACYEVSSHLPSMGLAPGGSIRQEIYEDERPVRDWDESHASRVFVHLLNSRDWLRVTGEAPPTTPITWEAYEEAEIPWFDHYREDLHALPGGSGLDDLRTLGQQGGLEDDPPTGRIVQTGPSDRPREVKSGAF